VIIIYEYNMNSFSISFRYVLLKEPLGNHLNVIGESYSTLLLNCFKLVLITAIYYFTTLILYL